MHSQIQLYVNLHTPYVHEKEKIMLSQLYVTSKHPVDSGFKIIIEWYGMVFSALVNL